MKENHTTLTMQIEDKEKHLHDSIYVEVKTCYIY